MLYCLLSTSTHRPLLLSSIDQTSTKYKTLTDIDYIITLYTH